MTTSPSPIVPSPSSNNGACGSSLPRWRLLLSMLNWRRDPDYERRMNALAIRNQQIEKETGQIESDISRVRKETGQIESDILQVRKETAQIEKETALLKEQNARGRELLASIDALCLEDDSSSTPAPSTPAATALSSP